MISKIVDGGHLVAPEVAAFAAAVRAQLDDLERDERDELTDGLEAELADRVADSGADSLGDPVAYADELRAAAGIPSRRPSSRVLGVGLARAVRFVRQALASRLVDHPRAAAVATFFIALRPVWWVLRAFVAFQVFAFLIAGFFGGTNATTLLPVDGAKVLVLAALIVLSVQFGRGRWLPQQWMRRFAGGVHLVLIVTAPFVLLSAITIVNNGFWAQQQLDSQAMDDIYAGEFAISADGTAIENVFVYDAQGNPVPSAQLFDQDGRPLNLVGHDGQEFVSLPEVASPGVV